MARVNRGSRAVAAEGERLLARARKRGAPKDEYDELDEVLKEARADARALHHRLGHWKRRPYAPATAANAACLVCSAMAMVNLEIQSTAHGPAVTTECPGGAGDEREETT